MARKPVIRALPALRELFPRFRGVRKRDHGQERATEILRRAARLLKRGGNRPFYSMREAARFCAVTVSTMGLVYQRLEEEGLIVRIRGSRTVLLGKEPHSRHAARSIVSIPIPLSALISSHFTRHFCQSISEELWKYHFVANMILFPDRTDGSAAFAERLVKQSDIVMWMMADRRVKEVMLIVRDHGVQNVILEPIEDPFLPAHYLLDWPSVYRRVLLDWMADGIRHVVVARPAKPESQKAIDHFLRLVRELDCAFTLAEPTAAALLAESERRREKNISVGCAILEHGVSHHLCNREPAAIARLTKRCRVLFGRGRVYAPYFLLHHSRADVIGFVGDEIAARVARDLGRRSEKGDAVLLEPLWMPRAELSKIFI